MEGEEKLKKAIADKDFYGIVSYIVEQQNLLLNKWFNEPRQNFRSTLQQMLQKTHVVKRKLVKPDEELAYEMGTLEGWIQAFYALYDTGRKEDNILMLINTKNPNTMKILHHLNQCTCPIRHMDLADVLGMGYSELAEEMKMIIVYGAVIASRTAQNTCYSLTPEAKRCLSKN